MLYEVITKHVNLESRLKAPAIRKDQGMVEVGWDEALAKVASELRTFKKAEIAVIGSAFASNEDSYILQKFATEVLGTRNVDFVLV